MAEILIRKISNQHPDQRKDGCCYKAGDVVVVMPDGHPWGARELDPQGNFVVISKPGDPVSDWAFLTRHRQNTAPDQFTPALMMVRRLAASLSEQASGMKYRRQYRVNVVSGDVERKIEQEAI